MFFYQENNLVAFLAERHSGHLTGLWVLRVGLGVTYTSVSAHTARETRGGRTDVPAWPQACT